MTEKVRPQLDEDVVDELTEVVNEETRIPADRLNFGERVELLVEMYHERGDTIEEYEDAIGQYKQRVQELRGQIQGNKNDTNSVW
jgi:hypothetical protein